MIADGKKQWSDPIEPDGNAKVKNIIERIIREKYGDEAACTRH
jgi:hypothetical protein